MLSESRGSSHSNPLYQPNWANTNDSADIDTFSLMSMPEYVLIFIVHLLLLFLRGLMFHLLTHIWLQMGRGFKTNKGKKRMEMGRSIKAALSCVLYLLYIRWKILCLCASDSLFPFNISNSVTRTSIEAKWSFLFVPLSWEMRFLVRAFERTQRMLASVQGKWIMEGRLVKHWKDE